MAVLQNITDRIHAKVETLREKMIHLRLILDEDRKGWWICLAVLIVTVVRSGITYSFGVFVVELEALYHRPMAEQNWIGTLSFCISLMSAPACVAFIRTLKYRGYRWGGIIGTVILTVSCLCSSFVYTLEWMFLTHSLLYGVGSSLIYMASSLVIGEYFDKDHKYHVMATSILLCGYPIGSLVFNPLNAWLVTRFGWRVAFRAASVLIFFFGMICCYTFSSKEEVNRERFENEEDEGEIESIAASLPPEPPVNQRKCCTLQELKDRPEIVMWYGGNMLSYLGFYMPFLNLAFYMELKGIPPVSSSWCITLLSFAECVTYIVASFLGDYLKGKLVYVNVIAASALAVLCIAWPYIDVSYAIICIISIIMGGFLGLTIVYTYAASGEVTDLPIDIAWSWTNLWSGAGILVGPFFSGFIYDFRRSYDDVFWVVGAMYVIDVALFALIPYIRYRRDKQEASKLDYNDIAGVVGGQNRQTFKVTNRSLSKSSLKDEEVMTGYQQQQPPRPPRPPPAGYQSQGAQFSSHGGGYDQGAGGNMHASDPLNATGGGGGMMGGGSHAGGWDSGHPQPLNNQVGAGRSDYGTAAQSHNAAAGSGSNYFSKQQNHQDHYQQGYVGH